MTLRDEVGGVWSKLTTVQNLFGTFGGIQSCRDLPGRLPFGLKAGNLTPVFQ
jgi:hypothetical protein